MVPQKGTRFGDRNLQCRNKCRRCSDAATCVARICPLGLARLFFRCGSSGLPRSCALALAVSPARATSAVLRPGTRLYSKRQNGELRQNPLDGDRSASTNLGVCRRQVPDRSDLVVLLVLDPGVPGTPARFVAPPDPPADRCHLCTRRLWKRRRRLALLLPSSSRQNCESGSQSRPACLRNLCRSDRLCI